LQTGDSHYNIAIDRLGSWTPVG